MKKDHQLKLIKEICLSHQRSQDVIKSNRKAF